MLRRREGVGGRRECVGGEGARVMGGRVLGGKDGWCWGKEGVC